MCPTGLGNTTPSALKTELARDARIASDAARLADWVDALVLTIESSRMHPLDDSALHKLHADLEASTRSCLDQIGDFTIRVEEWDLLFEDRCIQHSVTPEGSLSVVLFRDGLRELVIRKGLESDELLAFVGILERVTDLSGPNSEGVVTLLWEGNFRHIDYACVPFDEWETDSGPESADVASSTADEGIPWATGGQAEEGIGPGSGGSAEDQSDDWPLSVHEASLLTAAPRTPCEFTEIEANNVLMVAKFEEALSTRDQVLEIISAVLIAEENPSEFLEVASIIGHLVEHAVREGDMAGADRVLDRLGSISKTKATERIEFQVAADQILQDIGRGEVLDHLRTLFKRNRPVDLSALVRFLAQLGPTIAPALCDLLGELGEMKTRRAVCEALAISCKNDVDILIERLSDSRWFVVRNILYILGRIAHQGVERALGDALYHSDVRVRREAVRAIGEIKSPAGRAYLNSALRDSDKTVRISVAGALAERHNERAARIIWGVIESPEFAGRDSDERIAFLQALRLTGSDALVEQIEQTLIHRGRLDSRNQESRADAAMALAWLGTPAALVVLSRAMESRNDAVRRAVTEALDALRKSIPKDRQGGSEGETPAGEK